MVTFFENSDTFLIQFCLSIFQSSRTSLSSQHRSAPICQIRAGSVPGHCERAAVEAQVVGQADREGAGQLQEDARLVLRRQCHHAAQVTHTEERRTCQADVLLTSCYPL